ncbi:MAG: hypothetical protein ACI8QI_000842 [Limisphaerales bacterium]|jgi:hypothetical protein
MISAGAGITGWEISLFSEDVNPSRQPRFKLDLGFLLDYTNSEKKTAWN